MKKNLTKIDIESLAFQLLDILEEKELAADIRIYYNGKAVDVDSGHYNRKTGETTYKTKIIENINPLDFFEYVAYNHIISMSFEGPLYDMINDRGMPKEVNRLFEEYNVFYELGNSWNLSLYPMDESAEIEYTYYTPVKDETVYFDRNYSSIPNELKAIQLLWRKWAEEEGDRGSCVIGAHLVFKYKDKTYSMPPDSPYQGEYSWCASLDKIKQALINIGATDLTWYPGNMD